MTEDQIKHMVDRFLMWRLPENFSPDNGVIFSPIAGEGGPFPFKREPSGTNLLDATQATAMVRHMLEGLPPSSADSVPVAYLHQCRDSVAEPQLGFEVARNPQWTSEPLYRAVPQASSAATAELEEDDPEVMIVARGIAEHGFGRSWDDFHSCDASQTDQGDLIQYAQAAVFALRSQAETAMRATSANDRRQTSAVADSHGEPQRINDHLRAAPQGVVK